MWTSLSLRARLGLLLCLIFSAALVTGGIALRSFAFEQLLEESEPAMRSARLVAGALNNTLAHSPAPSEALKAFVEGLGTPEFESLRFESADTGSTPPPDRAARPAAVPAWFADLLGASRIGDRIPIMIDDRRVGDLVYEPDVSADLREKWVSFLSLAFAGTGLAAASVLGAFLVLNPSRRSLAELGAGLARLRGGDYGRRIPVSGPPEIRQSSEAANSLATTLAQLETDNRTLLRKIVSLQDDERSDIARELHDELGPLLFAIRANAVAMLEATTPQQHLLHGSANKAMDSAEALQHAIRRILDRLQPLHIEQLGLAASVESLLRDARAHSPPLRISSDFDPDIATEGVVSQTVYRVIQEGVTNVLRHAHASHLHVRVRGESQAIRIEISDDGIGMTSDQVFGRGLTGMRERARALGGSFELRREAGRTVVRCWLPQGKSA
jgi:two-component system sensor histidine kinase UhpB